MGSLKRVVVTGALICLAVVTGVRASATMADISRAWAASTGDSPNAAVALVLGHRLQDGAVDAHFARRLDRALALYRQGRVRWVLVTGGGDPPESEAGKAYLVARGLPAERIRTETRSCSTFENIANSKPWLPAGVQDEGVLLITSGVHLRRALTIARDQGLAVTGVAADDAPPAMLAAWPSVIRETAALAVYPWWVSPANCGAGG